MIITQQEPSLSSDVSVLNKKGMGVWLMGLSGAGKSTIAGLLKQKLEDDGIFSVLLDGDTLRGGINKNLGFSNSDRLENVRRAAEVYFCFFLSR